MKASPSLIYAAFLGTGESVLWQETYAVQLPELPATTTCSSCQ